MADKKISALTASTTPLAGTEVLPVVQSGSTVQVSIANVTAGRSVSTKDLTAISGTSTPYLLARNTNAVTLATAELQLITANSFSGVSSCYIKNESQSGGNSNADLVFFVNSTGGGSPYESARLKGVGGDLQLATGNLVIGTAGKGIDFSAATHAAGMTSELLNDYEEGTWTPSVGGLATYFSQNGTYTKVGRLVFVQGLIYINSILTGSTTTISGLPFTPGNDSTVTLTYFGGLATNVVFINGRIAAGASTIIMYGLTAAGATAQTPITTFQNQTYVQFSAVYSV